jgi:predicted metalloprotease
MKWTRGYQSDDVEVRRGGSSFGGGGMVGPILSAVVSRFGLGGGVIALLAFGAFYLLSGSGQSQSVADSSVASADSRVQFASFVLDDIQRMWKQKVPDYRPAKLVIYENGTSTGCGYGQSATGPFYCPRDEQVYLDLDFFRTLEQRLGARGDFAQAYVIAHELGHHVQNQLGLTDGLQGGSVTGPHSQSVKVELQADCFAGVWAHSSGQRDLLEGGDIEEALTAAASIGDDRLQKAAHGTVQPERWTHGSSAQRVQWFKKGLESGDPRSCS